MDRNIIRNIAAFMRRAPLNGSEVEPFMQCIHALQDEDARIAAEESAAQVVQSRPAPQPAEGAIEGDGEGAE